MCCVRSALAIAAALPSAETRQEGHRSRRTPRPFASDDAAETPRVENLYLEAYGRVAASRGPGESERTARDRHAGDDERPAAARERKNKCLDLAPRLVGQQAPARRDDVAAARLQRGLVHARFSCILLAVRPRTCLPTRCSLVA